jgi:hypothetical protein
MADETPPTAFDRIDRAIARIEAAMAASSRATESALRRHTTLRSRMEEAVTMLDDILTRGTDS